MAKYYKVKPEFDGRVLTYIVPDGRKKLGYRVENIELVGMELLPPKKWEQITNGFPERLDMADEVKVNIYLVYRSFGVLFNINDEQVICGEYIAKWKQLRASFEHLYFSITHRYANSKIVNMLSIESLEFAIKYYESLQEVKSNA